MTTRKEISPTEERIVLDDPRKASTDAGDGVRFLSGPACMPPEKPCPVKAIPRIASFKIALGFIGLLVFDASRRRIRGAHVFNTLQRIT